MFEPQADKVVVFASQSSCFFSQHFSDLHAVLLVPFIDTLLGPRRTTFVPESPHWLFYLHPRMPLMPLMPGCLSTGVLQIYNFILDQWYPFLTLAIRGYTHKIRRITVYNGFTQTNIDKHHRLSGFHMLLASYLYIYTPLSIGKS